MTKAYSVSQGDVILFVGEGNFSFTKDFLTLNSEYLKNGQSNIEVVTSCREGQSETFSEFKQNNIKYLCDQGVTVIFNVDATKLKFHPSLQNKIFSKVIFNFPHVGGKMKIHLNRILLRDFFSSACDVLSDNGFVIVALCDGQGGTGADKKPRRWDDSWQITEVAAQADLILHQVEPFDISCFPHYINIGFRSGDKSFHCKNALVHTFKRKKLPAILQDCPDRWLRDQNIKEELIYEFLDERMINPFSSPQSASSYIFDTLTNEFSFTKFHINKPVLTYNCFSNCESKQRICSNNQIDECQQCMLNIFLELSKECDNTNIITRGLVKKVNINDFFVPPVRCLMVAFGVECHTSVFLDYLSQMLLLFNCEWQLSVKKIDNTYQYAYIFNSNAESCKSVKLVEVITLKNGILCHICHIDELAQVLFNLFDWRSLWNGHIDCSTECPTFSPTSLYPRAFSFDLGLSVPLSFRDKFEEQLFLCLWLLAGDIITKVELLNTYLPSDRELICFCYRITYKSFNAPLFRKRVIHIHEKVIATLLSKYLQINIT